MRARKAEELHGEAPWAGWASNDGGSTIRINNVLRRWCEVALFLSCCCLALHAKQQHLKYEDPGGMEIYELTFDDKNISVATIEKIVWFSPYLEFDLKDAPFQMSGSWMGKDVVDRSIMIPWLEVCNPGYDACDHPILNAALLRNAGVNLQRGRQQIEKLKQMDIPKELWPIRDHFLVGMEFSLNQHGVRYHYLKSGDVEPMRKRLRAVSLWQAGGGTYPQAQRHKGNSQAGA